jgi:hypothetical protein
VNTHIRTLLLLMLIGSEATRAAGESYLTLVGELLGAVESPRLIRDACATRFPSTAKENSQLYDAWKSRHKALLDSIAEQVRRANVRLKKQGAPGGDEPSRAMVEALGQGLEQSISEMTPDQIARFCGRYPKLIETKDVEARTSIPKLLSIVENADKELALREGT